MKTKTFDCVEMKNEIQERVTDKTRSMTSEEELAYYRQETARFQRHLTTLREQSQPGVESEATLG